MLQGGLGGGGWGGGGIWSVELMLHPEHCCWSNIALPTDAAEGGSWSVELMLLSEQHGCQMTLPG